MEKQLQKELEDAINNCDTQKAIVLIKTLRDRCAAIQLIPITNKLLEMCPPRIHLPESTPSTPRLSNSLRLPQNAYSPYNTNVNRSFLSEEYPDYRQYPMVENQSEFSTSASLYQTFFDPLNQTSSQIGIFEGLLALGFPEDICVKATQMSSTLDSAANIAIELLNRNPY